MKMKMKKDKNTKKTWIQYGVLAVAAITVFATGMQAEVIGFAQRGLLATGLMNPNVEVAAQPELDESGREVGTKTMSELPKADFSLKLIDKEGNTTSLEDLKGKVIFMNLWATWCPPCIAEMPSIEKLYKEMGQDVAFVMLSLDRNFETAKAFDKKKGYNLPIYAPASGLPAMYQSSSIPTTYVIDAEGNLAWSHKGMADYSDSDFKAFLNSLR